MPVILQKDAPLLRKKASEVRLEQICGVKFLRILKEMREALETQDDGVALAAPQIGVSLRVFIVSKAALNFIPERGNHAAETSAEAKKAAGYLVFINPVIVKLSRDKATCNEGCLSVRPLYGRISRSRKATIRAYDEKGKKFTRGASGLLAQIFQHECDHLEGILFTDKTTDLRKMPEIPEN